MDIEKFKSEIKNYSTDDLKLILATQRELYSDEEINLIEARLIERKRLDEIEQQTYIQEHLPKEINCPKCDGLNDFSNDNCCYCGYKLNKDKYYSINYYKDNTEDEETESTNEGDDNDSYVFQYIISFIVPLVGFILGAILMSKDNEDEKTVGKELVIIGLLSIVIFSIIWFIVF